VLVGALSLLVAGPAPLVGQTGGDKIDYVLVQPGTTVLEASIVRTSRDGRYPSDHFPVLARIEWPDATR